MIRQLCSLGLDSHMMMPRLLSLLHDYIPSFANVYFWLATDGSVTDIYDEHTESYAALPLYLSEYCNAKELEVWDGLAGAAKTRTAVDMDELWKVDKSQLLKHDFYEDFLKQTGHFNGLHRSIYVADKPRGLLQLKRTIGERPFSPDDSQKLDKVAKHIEFAIANEQLTSEPGHTSANESATLIIDTLGKVHHYTDKAERIMMLSQSNQEIDQYSRFSFSSVPRSLRNLVTRLQKIQNGRDCNPATRSVSNKWGKFVFSVTPLHPQSSANSVTLYLLNIEHQVPMKIRLINNLDRFGLSKRQLEICLHISADKSYSEIAEQMGVMESTVISHRKALFGKLGIANRHQLASAVLANQTN